MSSLFMATLEPRVLAILHCGEIPPRTFFAKQQGNRAPCKHHPFRQTLQAYTPAPGRARCAAKGAPRCSFSRSGIRYRPASAQRILFLIRRHRLLEVRARYCLQARCFQCCLQLRPHKRKTPPSKSRHKKSPSPSKTSKPTSSRPLRSRCCPRLPPPTRSACSSPPTSPACKKISRRSSPRSSTKTTNAANASRSTKPRSHPRRPQPSRRCSFTTNVLPV